MGPTESITLDPPVRHEDGTWTGGLAIERGDGRCKPVKDNTRCYTIANSYQSQKGIWAPAQTSKINGSFDENNLMRRNLNIVCCSYMLRVCFCELTPRLRGRCSVPHGGDAADPGNYQEGHPGLLCNAQHSGARTPGNTAHNTLQLNAAPAVPHGSGS